MENVVAVRVVNDLGQARYFVTWGRILDSVDSGKLESLILREAAKFSIGGTHVRADVCDTLQEASGQPYFYEAILSFAGEPWGDDFGTWREAIAEEMDQGEHIYFLGTIP